MSQRMFIPVKNLEDLLHRMTDRIRKSLELPEILDATVDEMRQFLKTDRVKVYQFQEDGSGEVVAEAINHGRLPSLLGQKFPADDIPAQAREMFLSARQRSIVNVIKQEIGLSPLLSDESRETMLANITFRTVDPCHVEYLSAMGVKASLVVPILHRHRLWGLLVAHHSIPRRFGNKELKIVQMIADQVTVAIAHASLLQLTRLQGQHESIINQIVSQLHSTVKNPLKRALTHMVIALECSGGRLYIPTGKRSTDRTNEKAQIVTAGKQPAISKFLTEKSSSETGVAALEQCFDWQTWLQSETSNQIVENFWAITDINDAHIPSTMRTVLACSNIRSLLVVKLVHQNRFLGYLSLFRQAIDIETIWAGRLDPTDIRQQRPRQSFDAWREIQQDQANPWNSREIGLAQDLADRFSSVIYQTQLYQKVQALNADLEQRVSARTIDLEKINQDLKQEIAERERALTALHEARDSLKRLSHQNELILNAAGEGIYGIDPKGKIVFANPAAAKLLGGSENTSLVGQFMHDVLKHSKPEGELYEWAQSPIFKTLRHGRTHHVTGDLFYRQDGSSFPIEYVSTSIQEQGKVIGAVVIFQDITERQAMELMKDEFIAVVSHELRTPLTSIRAALGLLSQSTLEIPAHKRQRMVEIAFSNTNRLVRLVSDILDIERIRLGKITLNKTICNLSDIMAQAADEMRAMADKYSIRLSVSALSVQICADPDRIIQTLTNLLSNAIKFSPAGSTVTVTAQQLTVNDLESIAPLLDLSPVGQKAIKSGLEIAESLLLIQVKDKGKGIPENKLEAIFAQFEQLNTSDAAHQGGTGLGLAICRSIVQQHQGEIWAQSKAEAGSRFCFTLPISTQPILD